MKYISIPKSALVFLVAGLLLTTLPPILSRYFSIPDLFRGFITGVGLTFEVIALAKIQRSKKGRSCAALKD